MEPQQINPIDQIEATPPALSGAGRFRPWLIIGITIVATGLVVGGGVYGAMSKRLASERTALEQKMSDLENQVTQLQVTVNAKSEVDTSDWKIYRNVAYGYEMKYPNDWTGGEDDVNTNNATIYYSTGDIANTYIAIHVFDNKQQLPIEEWWSKYNEKGDARLKDKGTFTVAGLTAKVYQEAEGFETSYYIITRDSRIYLIDSFLTDSIMHGALSTFKFLDAAPAN